MHNSTSNLVAALRVKRVCLMKANRFIFAMCVRIYAQHPEFRNVLINRTLAGFSQNA